MGWSMTNQKGDVLNMDFIMSLARPVVTTMLDGEAKYAVIEFYVDIGEMAIDVHGQTDYLSVIESSGFTDGNGNNYHPDDFYLD